MGASINVCLLIYCLLIVRLEMSVLSMSVRQRKEDNISSADVTVKVIVSNISKNIKDIKRVKNKK